MVVGDSPYDAEAARKAGLQTIGVLCGGFAEADLAKAGCIGIFGGAVDPLRRYEGSCQNVVVLTEAIETGAGQFVSAEGTAPQ